LAHVPALQSRLPKHGPPSGLETTSEQPSCSHSHTIVVPFETCWQVTLPALKGHTGSPSPLQVGRQMYVPPGAEAPAQAPEPLQSMSLVHPRLQYEVFGREDAGSETMQMSHVLGEQAWPTGTRHVRVNRLQFRDLQP
jgi:hypothetical protein